MLTPAQKKERHLAMFGVEDIETNYVENMAFPFMTPSMLAMSILSDAQEEIEHGSKETARKYINKAKWIISEKLMAKTETK